MKEYKFRAWDKNKNKMVYGDGTIGNDSMIETQGDILDWFEDEDIMQYTGLHDKNGKEIYEADLILQQNIVYSAYHLNDEPEIVVFSSGVFCLAHKSGLIKEINLLNMVLETAEIIGNIYENPELLKAPYKK